MEDKLYDIPVKDSFNKKCECPICEMYSEIEKGAIEFTMGPSYMEDYVRFETDEKGFCDRHVKQLYDYNNRLGLAIIMDTHLQKTNKDIRKISGEIKQSGFFKKKDTSELNDYIDNLTNSCFVCDKVNNTFDRYISTIFHLWKNDTDFVKNIINIDGFCTKHFGLLVKESKKNLSGSKQEEFISTITRLYLDNMERISNDIDWFIKKFDYRYKDESWKESKDALPRTLIKTNSITEKISE